MADKTNNPVSTDEHGQSDCGTQTPSAQELEEMKELEKQKLDQWYEKAGFYHPVEQ